MSREIHATHDESLQLRLDRHVLNSLPAVALGMFLLYLFFATAHLFFLSPPVAQIMVPVAAISALLFFGLLLMLRLYDVPCRWANALTALMAGIALFNSLLHLFLARDLLQTTNLLLLVVAVCCVMLKLRWVLLVYVAIWLGWLGVMVVIPADAAKMHFAVALVTASVLGVIVFYVRRTIITRFEWLHMQDGARKRELGAALAEQEASLERLEQLNRELTEARNVAQAGSRARSSFLANISHEIRTPLNGVLGLTGMALDSELDEQQRGWLQTVQSSARGLLAIIDDILDFSRIDTGNLQLEPRAFDPHELMNSLDQLFGEQARVKGLRLDISVAANVPRQIEADPGRLRQVFFNLLSNALKFSERGRIGVELALSSGGSRQLVLSAVVEDTGIGISAEQQAGIFDAFSQADNSLSRRYGGTGLGLSIAAQLVGLMGGSMRVSSEPGRGSRFFFDFRATLVEQPLARSSTGAMAQITAPKHAFRILVVEDNTVNQAVTKAMLRKLGHEVEIAENGRHALETLYADSDFDLVLMDLQMPLMDGYEATAAIRAEARWADLPIVALTAHARREDEAACLQAGMNGFLSKPLLREALEEMLNGLSPRRAVLQSASSPQVHVVPGSD